ncbi:MAG TPA: hypothetical protein VNZ22_01460 [Bacillota bacterium]|nr:hypothetical protein [Bacillota bacterium]
MRTKSCFNPTVPQMVGTLATGLGLFLAIASVCVRTDGTTIIMIPDARIVAGLALIFILAGLAVCQKMRLAQWVLGPAFACLALCQILAAFRAANWVGTAQHGLFAMWLWGGAFVLWIHREEPG